MSTRFSRLLNNEADLPDQIKREYHPTMQQAVRAFLHAQLMKGALSILELPEEMLQRFNHMPHKLAIPIQDICDALEGVKETPGLFNAMMDLLDARINNVNNDKVVKIEENFRLVVASIQGEGEPLFQPGQIDRITTNVNELGKALSTNT